MTQFQYAPSKRKLDKIVGMADEVQHLTLDEIEAKFVGFGNFARRCASLTGYYSFTLLDKAAGTERKVCILVREG